MRFAKIVRRLGLGAFFLLAVASCGDSCKPREREIQRDDLELMVWQDIEEKGKFTPAVTCPHSLDAKVGEHITCFMIIKGQKYDVDVTIAKVDGTKVEFDIEIASEPRPDAGAR